MQNPDMVAITINPGDKVLVLVPERASQAEIAAAQMKLSAWAPEVTFLVISGPQSIAVIPTTPVEDKAPHGLDANGTPAVYVRCQRNYAKMGEAAHAAVDCPGPPECI